MHLLSLLGHLAFEGQELDLEPTVAVLFALLLLAVWFDIESEDAALERRLVEGVAKVCQVFIELLHAFEVRLLHLVRCTPEEVGVRVLEELPESRLPGRTRLEG